VSEAYVEVAVPVPLRRRFTYRVPVALAERVALGSRVAVPFSGRKVSGFVVGHMAEPPEGVSRIRELLGLLDDEPVFPDELLGFLLDAAAYYMHPIGEVLRAAAPALSSKALRDLHAGGALADDEDLPGARLSTRISYLATARSERPPRLGPKQRAVLDLLDARGPMLLEDLQGELPITRAFLRALGKKGLVDLEEREVVSDAFFGTVVARDTPPALHPAQSHAVQALAEALDSASSHAFLLQGVTGSGKTEVYLRVIERALAADRGALVLVPEIALTPQLVARFRARLGDAIAVLHSGLTDRQRYDSWRALRMGRVKLAIGARSALFAPVKNLGVIVVDEEHDPSFKQEDGFRYHARDMALLRASRAGAIAVLGSATPSIEIRHRAEQQQIARLVLPDRATSHSLPPIEIVDLARHREGPSKNPLLSAPLYRAIERALSRQEQAILFLNRRGFAPSVRCKSCGAIAECPACSVPLTEHRKPTALICHYCDFATPLGQPCASCESIEQIAIGIGTEQLEQALATAFAPARVGRLDRDTARGAERVLERFRLRELDILVGTQMVTKGHDLPGVTVVGVVLADQSLAFPDFRASERTFQLLSQVAGRAGRGDRPGEVFFQGYLPEHPAVRLAARHDYEAFFQVELVHRRELGYAPFSRMVAVRIDAADEQVSKHLASELAAVARRQRAVADGVVHVLGPAPAPIARLRARYRHRLMLRSADRKALRAVAHAIAARIDEGVAPARASVDIDPVSML
jgi:primosomal protein N' (replication factor Y)